MKSFRAALAQITPVLGHLERNLELHLDRIDEAARQGAEVVVFPELSLTGYVLRDQVPDLAVPLEHPLIRRLAEASRKIDVVAGFVEDTEEHRFHNVAAYFSRGETLHVHRKLYLPTYGLHDEGRDFASGQSLRTFQAPYGESGLLICEDLWHPTCAWLLAQQGAQIIIAPSSGPTRGARPGLGVTSVGVWRQLLQVTAQFQTSFLIYVNRVGCEDGLTFGGGSTVVDPFGRIVGELPPLDEGMLVVDVDAEILRRARAAYPLLRDERIELVRRELERLRRRRCDLPADESEDDPAGTVAPSASPTHE